MAEQTVLRLDAQLEPTATSAGQARALIRQALGQVGETAVLDAAELAVSELVTNAILHAATAVDLTVDVTRSAVTVSVRDWHPRLPTQRHWGQTATTGRGLALVAALSDEFGVDPREPVGKSVWFRLLRGTGRAAADDARWDVAGRPRDVARAAAVKVVLAGLPRQLWEAGQQHWEAVLRELYLYVQSHESEGIGATDLVAAGRGLAALSAAVERALEPPDAAASQHVEASLLVADDDHTGFGQLQDALDAGGRLAAEGKLLIRPALPEIVALRDWACEQVLAQVHGVPGVAWAGTDQPRFLDPAISRRVAPAPAWEAEIVTRSTRAAVAADDSNRVIAVSPSAADLLGWDAQELTGRRIVTIVPPEWREAHVAGFTRHLTTGETQVLDTALQLPVLCADGTEKTCSFLIERVDAERGRSVYVAWIDPVDS